MDNNSGKSGRPALHPSTLSCAADPAVLRSMSDTSDVFVMALLDSSPDCIKLVERDGTLSYMNPNGQCAMEIDDFNMVAGAPWASLWPQASRDEIAASVHAALDGKTSRIEAFCPTARGTPRWWDVSVSPVLAPDGSVARVLSVSRDITPIIEREERLRRYDQQLSDLNRDLAGQLQRADVLMREIDHRVKNSLAMIASILRMQARKAQGEEARTRLVSAAARVTTVARVHERLQVGEDIRSVDLAAYLPAIAEDVGGALTGRGVSIATEVAAVMLESDRAAALGMITSELLTNAVKHAFDVHDTGGKVSVTLSREGDRLQLRVADNGRGGCDLPGASSGQTTGTGLGSRIIDLYVRQLGGTLSCNSPAGAGTAFALELPIDAPLAPAE